MKKILSALLVVAMLVSMFAVFAIPTAAVEGMFDTHGKASHEVDGYDGDVNSIPGYEYTPDGFHMTTADWTTGTPFSHMSTKEKVDLKDGVYMQVRVDTFNYDTNDKWFNFNIWSQDAIDEGSGDEQFGTGVQTLIRPGSGTAEKHGTLGAIAWYTKAFKHTGSTNIPDAGKAQVDGKNVLTLVVTYDPAAGYSLTINGSAAPEKVIAYMNETYADDSEAYIGFTMYSNKKGGEQSATILKFGTSENDASKPMGDDYKQPENYTIVYDPIIDASTVADGQPAIIMSGDKQASNLKGTPTSTTGSIISITEDSLIHVVGTQGTADCGVWNVKNDASYDIADFPVIMVMTKNFCSCGGDDGECWAYEEASVYLATGEEIVPSPSNKISGLQPDGDAYFINDDGYLIFFYDVTADLKTEDGGKFEGRINATRFDFIVDMSTPGANEYDVVMQGFFRTEEDAVAYAMDYLVELGYDAGGDTETEPKDPETTEPETDTAPETTEPKAPETTEPKTPETTESKAPANTETEPKAPAATEKGDDNASSGGCGSTVGLGAIALVAVAAVAGFVSFKKKD